MASFARERVLELEQGERASVVQPGEAAATRWSSAGVVLTLPEARRIGRVAFELSDAPWVAQPSVEASLDGVAWEPVEATASLADATLSLYRDPKAGRGEIRFAPRPVRFLRLDARLPARGAHGGGRVAAQTPANCTPSKTRVGVRRDEYGQGSLPTAASFFSSSSRLPAMFISATGSARSPPRMRKPWTPNE